LLARSLSCAAPMARRQGHIQEARESVREAFARGLVSTATTTTTDETNDGDTPSSSSLHLVHPLPHRRHVPIALVVASWLATLLASAPVSLSLARSLSLSVHSPLGAPVTRMNVHALLLALTLSRSVASSSAEPVVMIDRVLSVSRFYCQQRNQKAEEEQHGGREVRFGKRERLIGYRCDRYSDSGGGCSRYRTTQPHGVAGAPTKRSHSALPLPPPPPLERRTRPASTEVEAAVAATGEPERAHA